MSNRSFDALFSGVRFGKFVSVGAVGAVFDMTTTTALIVLLGVLGEYAKLVGAEVAIIVMFVINENWTFADEGAGGTLPTIRRFLTSNLVRSGGLALQFFIVRSLRQLDLSVIVFGFDFWQVIPIPIAIAASMLVNYVAESTFTWRISRP
ncbi:GtrA family protein [Halopelagius longus]|uniref:GtrA family protein n=1 Tax=Halopelagius longus TaxID=1236180 RepID=A0A1H1DCU0_9EURY|nr:GtrA family protein [Halopelagius longus]RDI71268.1 GtrA family protein [Halopelagius longus]SDQ74049.1 Putative flippase GtrA (transmembrane translocase of bactoprenol-linked glucose) [Halopelagius longus]